MPIKQSHEQDRPGPGSTGAGTAGPAGEAHSGTGAGRIHGSRAAGQAVEIILDGAASAETNKKERP